jgi:hypothetical protein
MIFIQIIILKILINIILYFSIFYMKHNNINLNQYDILFLIRKLMPLLFNEMKHLIGDSEEI